MAKQRKRGFPLSCLVPPVFALWAWRSLHEPLHSDGLLVLLGLGICVGVMAPAVVMSVNDLPKMLVPARWRASWRQRRPREEQQSSYIPNYLRQTVFRADRYQCVWCHSRQSLQIDHIRPWAGGGLAVLWNLMTLCGKCNRIKSNYWKDRDGYVHYKGFEGSVNATEARNILRCEQRRRLYPGRWLRAGFALAA